jgi:asparagine synthase (glutamine-hydrolysing)
MCGIAGRYDATGLPRNDRWHVEADRVLRHRGPDGSGYFHDAHCELVHRRLALIDLSPTGHQPIANEDGSVQVIFNGEIYNHRELRADLVARGHRFRGTSDSEVLAHLYEQHGAHMHEHLRGMFAFAVYDLRKRQLVLARDRFGIKPLFVAESEGEVVFASEIKAILAAGAVKPRLDRQACYDFLGLGYIPEPATGFENIRMLPKGECIVFDAHGSTVLAAEPIRVEPRVRSIAEVVSDAEARLLAAVDSQSVADVPVAALLSGGIDSSLVVAAYARAREAHPKTFTVTFPDAAYDESEVATLVAKRYETDHHTIRIDETALEPDAIFALLEHFDQPFADTSLFAVHAVSRAIRDRGIICTLSGDGGDEAFGGYASFWRASSLVRLGRLPAAASRVVERVGELAAPYTRDLGRQAAKAVRFARAGAEDSRRLLSGLANYLDESQKEELVRADARANLLSAYRLHLAYEPRGTLELETLSGRITENYFALGLPSDMLRKVDMMSMAASIEVRVPMLDESLVQTGLSLPHALKTSRGTSKRVLRALAARWLPDAVVNHPKHGFGVPLDRMVSPRFHSAVSDLLTGPASRTRSILSQQVVDAWLALFRGAGAGHRGGTMSRGGLYQRIFFLLALELFLRAHELTW